MLGSSAWIWSPVRDAMHTSTSSVDSVVMCGSKPLGLIVH
jgi:hypothetical protein